jgi:hypothetical protein
MCKILMTVSADAGEQTEPNRAQKNRDFSFIGFKGGEVSTQRLPLIEKACFAKKDKN